MIDERFVALLEQTLQEVCHCSPDEYGDYPCDYGIFCDKCDENEEIILEKCLEKYHKRD